MGDALGEIVINLKEKTITRNTVLLVYTEAAELIQTGETMSRLVEGIKGDVST